MLFRMGGFSRLLVAFSLLSPMSSTALDQRGSMSTRPNGMQNLIPGIDDGDMGPDDAQGGALSTDLVEALTSTTLCSSCPLVLPFDPAKIDADLSLHTCIWCVQHIGQ